MIKHIHKPLFFSVALLLTHVLSHANDRNRVIATINVGVTPAGIALTHDNKVAYVANSNNYGITNGDSVSVLNLKLNLQEKTIHHPSFNQPYTVTLNKSGTKAYVTNSNSTTISVIDIAINEVVAVIDGFDGPSGMVITPDGKRAYVNNYGGPEGVGSGNGKTLTIVDLTTNTIVGQPIVVGLAPASLAVSPDGEFVYTINYVDGNPGTGTMSIVQTANNQLIATIPGFSGPFALALTSDGKYAYVTNFGSNNFDPIGHAVSVVHLKKRKIIETIELAIQPSGIGITPDDKFVYVTNYNTLYAGSNFTDLTPGEGTVNIIDTSTNTVIPPTIVVGNAPHGVTIGSNGKHAYISNYIANTVSVIELRC